MSEDKEVVIQPIIEPHKSSAFRNFLKRFSRSKEEVPPVNTSEVGKEPIDFVDTSDLPAGEAGVSDKTRMEITSNDDHQGTIPEEIQEEPQIKTLGVNVVHSGSVLGSHLRKYYEK